MDRTRMVAMVVAAVVGITGGVAGALGLGDPGQEETTSTSSGPDSGPASDGATADDPGPTTDQPAAPDNEPMFFHAAQQIHDGGTVIDVRPSGPGAGRLLGAAIPSAVTRRDGGYLLAFPQDTDLGEEVTREDLWRVEDDGSATRMARVAPGWDQDLDRTRVVGVDVDEGLLTVWDSTTGEPLVRWDGEVGEDLSAAYAGAKEEVLISVRTDPRTFELQRWDVAAGTTTTEQLPGYDRMGVSPGGSLVGGTVGPDGAASTDQDFCLQVHQTSQEPTDVFWQTCDWRPERLGRPQFSPDGNRLLAVPVAGGGENPAEYAVLDAAVGPDPLVARIPAPNGTVRATWADDDSVYLTGITYTDTFADFWVRQCTFDGECTELDSETPGEIVVGEIR